ncbi:MFS transporter fmqE [Paramyrothecium foliicola]|nr:MFS transporter fmqE [Paramyrothecium foliicola]
MSASAPASEKLSETAVQVVASREGRGNVDPNGLDAQAAAIGQGVSGYETLTILQTVKQFKFNTLICCLMTFSAATEGYQLGMAGNIIANAGFVTQFGTGVTAAGIPFLESSTLSLWNVITACGQFFAMVTLPFLSGRWGRKFAMYSIWFNMMISVIIECVAKDWRAWLASKIFAGIGVGCLQSTIPTYISEVAPVRIRGALLMTYTLWWLIGQFFAPIALYVMNKRTPMDYLTPIYTQWSQIGLMLLIFIFVPESPAWAASKGLEERAKKSLHRLHWEVEGYNVDHQYRLLVLNIEHENKVAAQHSREKWYAIFFGRDGLRTLISCWTLLTQQFIGAVIFFGYATYFFQQIGFKDPFFVTCIMSGITIAANLLFIVLADAYGRRVLSCGGTTVCWVCLVAVGILGVVPQSNATNYILILFTAIFNVGLVGNSSTGSGFIGEISSQRLRHYTAGFALAVVTLASIVMGVLIPYMVNANEWNWGLKTPWFFAGVGLPFTVAMWFLIPETKGRSAAELDELFENKVKPWRFHKATTMTERIVATEQAA